MIDEELRAILACPACKGVELTFEETRIICRACRKAYPVRDGIPVMMRGLLSGVSRAVPTWQMAQFRNTRGSPCTVRRETPMGRSLSPS